MQNRIPLGIAALLCAIGAPAHATTCDPTHSIALQTGVDADADGADDRWLMRAPDGTTVAAPILSEPAAGWRGSADLADQTGPLGTAPYPVLGSGRWIGVPASEAVKGTYTFSFSFEPTGFQTLWLVGEWAADDRIHLIINGIDTQIASNANARPPAPYLDNQYGPDATCANPSIGHVIPSCDQDPTDPCQPYLCDDAGAEARELHVAVAPLNLAPWLADLQSTNTITIEVENLSGAVGLLVTGGDGTTIPGGPAIQECRPSFDLAGFSVPDMDGDGYVDTVDTCPQSPSSDQTDTDGDGFGDRCDPCPLDPLNDGDWDSVCASAGDCDDRDDTTFAGAPEVDGDGVDNDCDGKVDEVATDEVCNDANDNDGDLLTDCFDPDCCELIECYSFDSLQPEDNQVCEHACEDGVDNESPSGDGSVDCDDPDCCIDLSSPCATDDDGDDFSECTGDCDDGNSLRNPGFINDCGGSDGDGIDNDCDGMTDEDSCGCDFTVGCGPSPTPGPCGCTSSSFNPVQLASALTAIVFLARRRRPS